MSFSPGQLKPSEQQQEDEQKEDSSAPAELQPHSLVFTLEDDSDGPTVCEPAAVMSSKPSPVDLEPHPSNSEGPSLSKSEEILHNHQLKKAETQVRFDCVGGGGKLKTFYNTIMHLVFDRSGWLMAFI